LAIAALLCCASGGSNWAQDTRITIAAAGSERLETDLKFLFDLAPTPLNKQWGSFEKFIKSFTEGADPKEPARLDFIFGGQELSYLAAVKYGKWDGRGGMRESIEAFSFNLKDVPGVPGLYLAEQQQARSRNKKKPSTPAAPPRKPFYVRNIHGQAVIAKEQSQLPANLPDPSLILKDLLPGGTDVAVVLKNDAATVEARRKKFQELRKELEAGVQFKRGEPEADFALRKLSLEQNLAEAERFLIEADQLNIGWTTDPQSATGTGALLLTGLPGTSLAASIEQLVQTPSHFANVTFGEKPSLQARVNFAIDDLRSGHAMALYDTLLPSLQGQMDSRPNLNAEGKQTAKTALAGLFEMLNASIPLKVLDAIVDVHATDDGKHVGLCAIRAADGTKAVPLLAMFPKIRAGWEFTANVGEHQGAALHTLKVGAHRLEEFSAVFGGEPVIHVATSKDAVWGAAGAGSLERLKQALDQAAQPAPTTTAPEFLTLQMRFGPWVQVLDVLRAKEPPLVNPDKAALEAQKTQTRMRKYALDAFGSGEDLLSATLRREGGEVRGAMSINRGLFKFLGTVMADFSAENL
jgi:hypothetical protein